MERLQRLTILTLWFAAPSFLAEACPPAGSPAAVLAESIAPKTYTIRGEIPFVIRKARAQGIAVADVVDAALCNFEDDSRWPPHDALNEMGCQDGPGICGYWRSAEVLLHDVSTLEQDFVKEGAPVDTAHFARLYGRVARYFAQDYMQRCTASAPIDDKLDLDDECQGRYASPNTRLEYFNKILGLAKRSDVQLALTSRLSEQGRKDAKEYIERFMAGAATRLGSRIDFNDLRAGLLQIDTLAGLGDVQPAPYKDRLREGYRQALESLIGRSKL